MVPGPVRRCSIVSSCGWAKRLFGGRTGDGRVWAERATALVASREGTPLRLDRHEPVSACCGGLWSTEKGRTILWLFRQVPAMNACWASAGQWYPTPLMVQICRAWCWSRIGWIAREEAGKERVGGRRVRRPRNSAEQSPAENLGALQRVAWLSVRGLEVVWRGVGAFRASLGSVWAKRQRREQRQARSEARVKLQALAFRCTSERAVYSAGDTT